MHVALILPLSLPFHGGAEVFEHRLALALANRGHTVSVFSATREEKERYGGGYNAERHTEPNTYEITSWLHLKKFRGLNHAAEIQKILGQQSLVESCISWIRNKKPDVVIVGNAWSVNYAIHARELYLAVKSMGIPIGSMHHDSSLFIERIIIKNYLLTRDWSSALENVKRALSSLCEEYSELETFSAIASPLYFRPDFVICNSTWNTNFLDPFSKIEKFVLHPSNPCTSEAPQDVDKDCDVLMINPQNRKNPELMAEIIKMNPDLKFTILRGGWHKDPFPKFRKLVKDTKAFKSGNVKLVRYARNIDAVYRKSKVVFFPSYLEGYGQAGVEPLFVGTPTLSSNYPPIVEAIGVDAPSACPYLDEPEFWNKKLHQLLDPSNSVCGWINKRVNELKEREQNELRNLETFLSTRKTVWWD